MAVLVHHDVVGLEISVHYVFGVKVLQSQHHLDSVDPCDFLRELSLFLQDFAKIPTRAVLQEQKHILSVLECEVQVDDEIVV